MMVLDANQPILKDLIGLLLDLMASGNQLATRCLA